MAGHEPRTQPQSRPVPRLGPLLALALLIGLLGMHGLGTASSLPTTGVTVHVSHHATAADPLYLCGGNEHQVPVRDADHADQMCASAALPGAPSVATPDTAPLTGMPSGHVRAQPAPSLALAHEPAGGRAPPLLADLQVLRT
ncbi:MULTISPECIES: DUF6153 family protein [Streptomyces]|uniref:Secreted protein n=1 Tax=Streptomyces spororaveus TaxID=284039 RepID=A0ABQ3TPF3_9ACTN|nr:MULTISPECIES: DUF6153 family protein [Streptomyces]MCX5309179.1 DUF6153 family protein [Streptomyces sp. NBC_00160]GHI82302.1 hypothetical protein Sspor_78630 [Streptomyces spororaveus]